jgi:hypothetical protein
MRHCEPWTSKERKGWEEYSWESPGLRACINCADVGQELPKPSHGAMLFASSILNAVSSISPEILFSTRK